MQFICKCVFIQFLMMPRVKAFPFGQLSNFEGPDTEFFGSFQLNDDAVLHNDL